MGALVPVLTSALVTQGVGLAVNEFSRRQSQDQALEQLQERNNLNNLTAGTRIIGSAF